MPRMIALAAIGVTRNGKTVYPEVGSQNTGTPFEFTAEEIKSIQKMEKETDIPMLRALLNEGSSDDAPSAGTSNTSAPVAPVAPTAPTGFTLANTGAELKAEAAKRGLDITGLTTKAQLVALLDANPVKAEEAPADEEGDEDL